mmetsp:Transcript_7319/g.15760  ORF Transcript_7319/g.15760 Transcript_7319/m.15760 type:complete len:241 (+) Transcript_7319:135-857(+)
MITLEWMSGRSCKTRPLIARSQTFTAVPPAEAKSARPGNDTPASTAWSCETLMAALAFSSSSPSLEGLRESHNFTHLSYPAVIQESAPTGPAESTFSASLWASTVCSSSEVATSQRRSFPSLLPVATRLLSDSAKAAQVTASPCPRSLRRMLRVSISMTAQEPEASPASISRPSSRQATHWVSSLNFEIELVSSSVPSLLGALCQSPTFVPLTTASLCGVAGENATLTTRRASWFLKLTL